MIGGSWRPQYWLCYYPMRHRLATRLSYCQIEDRLLCHSDHISWGDSKSSPSRRTTPESGAGCFCNRDIRIPTTIGGLVVLWLGEVGPDTQWASPDVCRDDILLDSTPAYHIGELLNLGEPAPYMMMLMLLSVASVIVVWTLLSRLLSSPWGRGTQGYQRG